MHRWQYRCETDPALLDRLGDEGWELVSVIVLHETPHFYFKRPQLSFTERVTLEQRRRVGDDDRR
ncbi:hypothetical protein [Alicyclobacillus macrosporangiidus]|uniref:hypothetical protein n=1 Tax=Alicyclobacillus macrosporangiidus TaxID=392015 RepID=UPI0004980883|nr:hypothetical protein [Alicyclobacillus macrosporangiidus]